jgi:TetR/AcrR family transcriptional regulator, mexJK operon transcriptional repressor
MKLIKGARKCGRPTQHVAAALTAHILDTAQDLFLKLGFGATSLNQIAAKASMTKRTLYVKVGDKAAIFSAVMRRLADQKYRTLTDIGPIVSTKERITHFCRELLALALEPEVLQIQHLMIAEAPRFPLLAKWMAHQMTYGAHQRLTKVLRDEVRRGRLAVDNPHLVAQLLLTMVIVAPQRTALYGLKPWSPARCSSWVQEAVKLFLQGCQIPASRIPS